MPLRDGCRIVFVEGLPFSGKSTLSEMLAEQVRLNGIECEWVSEGTLLKRYFPSVLRGFDTNAPVPRMVLRSDWMRFLKVVTESYGTYIVDSALSYAASYPLMSQDLPFSEINEDVEWIRQRSLHLYPSVIHLLSKPEVSIPASIEERGEDWREHLIGQSDANPYQIARGRTGVEGAIALAREHQELMRRLILDWHQQELDSHPKSWKYNEQIATGFLGLHYVEPPRMEVPLDVLQSYVGEYEGEEGRRFIIRLEGQHLVAYEPGGKLGPLVPRSTSLFHLRASDLDFRFEEARMVLERTDGTMLRCQRIAER